MFVIDSHRKRTWLQAGALTHRTRNFTHVRFELLASPIALSINMATLDPRNHTFIGGTELTSLTESISILHLHRTGFSMKHQFLMLGRNLRPRLINIDFFLLCQGYQHSVEVLSVSTAPRSQSTITQRHRRIRNDEFSIDFKLGAETITVLACAVGRIEREVSRCRLFETCITLWT